MHRIRIISSTKPLWIPMALGNETAVSYRTRSSDLIAPLFALPPPTIRTFHLNAPIAAIAANEMEPTFFKRMIRKMGWPDRGKYRRRTMGYSLYEDIIKSINYSYFFTEFKMPDSFYSWFVITELHVWMLMLRFMVEGKFGQDIRNNIVEAMWSDINRRKSKLKNANVVALKKQTDEISQQFNAAIIGYDEGIMADDKVLAGALWRRFFQCECNNPELLEKLVLYVRKQVNELDKMPSEVIMTMKTTPWLESQNR